MNDSRYTISITKVISDGKPDIHGFGEYHFKANVCSQGCNFGICDVYMIKDLPTIHKMQDFDFNNRTIVVRMKQRNENSFDIIEISL